MREQNQNGGRVLRSYVARTIFQSVSTHVACARALVLLVSEVHLSCVAYRLSSSVSSAVPVLEIMKRPCPVPRDIVRLNVGGQLFQSSRETLSCSAFFSSLLEFDGGDKDADGNVFVDRSGKLFEVLLECWRTSLRPPQSTVSLAKMQLLEECKYFVAEDVAARIRGRTVLADLSPMCRRIALDETEGDACLVNVFEASLARKDVSHLQLPPLLLPPQARSDPVLAGDLRHCKEHLSVQMGGILLRLQQDPAISKYAVIAGGAVVSALTGCAAGDVDLFFVGAPAGVEEGILAKIYDILMSACKERLGDAARLLVTRFAAAITLFKQNGPPIQIVLSTYPTVVIMIFLVFLSLTHLKFFALVTPKPRTAYSALVSKTSSTYENAARGALQCQEPSIA